jgi:hypothetical protein
MITATILGVVLIPAFFVLIERKKKLKNKPASIDLPDTNQHA